ncbi:hypothetical protein ACA910_002079 [Epithemia clementina (nom. ined.)]
MANFSPLTTTTSRCWFRFFLCACCALIKTAVWANLEDDHDHVHFDNNNVKYKIDDLELKARIPKPLSDHTATLVGTTVYLAGGCDAPSGNTYNTDSEYFECGSISNAFFALDLALLSIVNGTELESSVTEFQILPNMPVPRYRHAAAAANGKIWIHGGRSLVDDEIIPQLDVFDIELGTWSTYSGLEEQYLLSDHTGFSNQQYVYFAGGYDVNYTAMPITFRIDANASDLDPFAPNLVLEDMSPMLVERGDIAAAFTNDFAIVAGGFTHTNGFCEPHVHAEQYSFQDNTWSEIASITYGGAERALVALEGKIFAIGGERQVEGLCDLADELKPDPGEQTITLDRVERYDIEDNHWTILSDLPDPRFRFPAVGYKNLIYTFGGQLQYDESCLCYRTTDVVVVYEEVEDPTSAATTTATHYWSGASALGVVVMTAFLAWM